MKKVSRTIIMREHFLLYTFPVLIFYNDLFTLNIIYSMDIFSPKKTPILPII